MIDIWMIFTMAFTLCEVSLHTYKETLKKKLAALDKPTNLDLPVFTKVHARDTNTQTGETSPNVLPKSDNNR
jgi:hypothetical protein